MNFYNRLILLLLFPKVPAQIVIQSLKDRTNKLENTLGNDEESSQASQFVNEDIEEVLVLHHTALRIRADLRKSPSYKTLAKSTWMM